MKYTDTLTLIQKIKEGKDKEVVADLYKKVLPTIRKYVKRNGGTLDDAHDVFQESIMILYKKVMKGENDVIENVEGYLYQIGIYTWIKKVKEASRYQLISDDFELDKVTNHSINEVSYSHKQSEIIKNLFAGLGDKCKELLQLSIYSDLSQEDIMIRMGFGTIGAVKMQHKRCKKKMMALLKSKPHVLETLKTLSV